MAEANARVDYIHFIQIYGDAERARDRPFSLVQLLAVKSAVAANPDFDVFLHVDFCPTGNYWEEIQGSVTLRYVEPPKVHKGRKIERFAHQADILRLQILYEYGGCYLDIDTVTQKSLRDLLIDRVVMAREQLSTGEVVGLCNAVIVAPPRAEFVAKWLAEYDEFDGALWNEFSVRRPYELSKIYPSLIAVLEHKAFFWPSWEREALDEFFHSSSASYEDAYVFHLWGAARSDLLENLSPSAAVKFEGWFGRLCRKLLDPEGVAVRSDGSGGEPIRKVFEDIYDQNRWGFGSGVGSLHENNIGYVAFLSEFMSRNNITSVIDFGCGDWQFSRFINWSGIEYLGLDIVRSVVDANAERFGSSNVRFQDFRGFGDLPSVDLVICKEVLQHLSNATVMDYLFRLKRVGALLLVTNDEVPVENINQDIPDGGWRSLRLDRPPFNERAPIVYSWMVHYKTFITRKSSALITGR